ncbi:transketolase family protein [Candidatus Aminicenantes bacterium AC-335-A11]|jgi:transketolase|nr:transketolase family protein [SCandidatus Aminicenantes bacterium Aminicenantia_JdfR_composite]MCP2597381.1 transketolase family protein [Candidatus Aminicenantes bacterium AC-335-G13]MCP2618927.1 transketolase family protein [Candidatus Aminicenantes bacterium AC-335-A11]
MTDKEIKMMGLRDVYGETLVELGKKYKDIVVLDADLSLSTKTSLFGEKFPDRFFNMGVSEQDLMSTAAGLALAGKIPFVSTFAIFATGRAWEQIRQSICYPNLNVKIVASHGGITVGEDGATHQATEDLALMRVLPNMTVIVPADGVETRQVIEAVLHHKGPVYVRLSRPKFPVVLDTNYKFEIGKAKVLREGDDLTIIGMGITVFHSLKAAEELEKDGISAKVINCSTLKPLDKDTIIEAAKQTKAIITVEEHTCLGGLGGAVAEVIVQNFPVRMKILGISNRFGLSGKPDQLLDFFGISWPHIVKAAHKLLK